MTSYRFPDSTNGRHLLTVRRQGWAVVNTHAESGRNAGDRLKRDKQLQRMRRLGDLEIQNKSLDSDIMILAGDLNVGEGEDRCLVRAD